jgi:class 3 adenylate cyclase
LRRAYGRLCPTELHHHWGHDQVNHPAIILDIDETSLSNWPEIIANDYGYIPSGACNLAGPCGDNAWELSAQVLAIAPTLRLFNEVKAKNVRILCRFGAFVAKYMGDGVLAYFRYPAAHEDDAERAVRTELELVASVSALQERLHNYKRAWALRQAWSWSAT